MEKTKEQVQKEFIGCLKNIADEWSKFSDKTVEERLSGAMFSVLVVLDGESMMPAFKVIPDPHPSDKAFNKENGDDWYPNNIDIAGELHHMWHK